MSLSWTTKVGIGVLVLGVGIWFGVTRLRSAVDRQFTDAATRPYKSPNHLVIASVPSDFGSEATFDGALILRKQPSGAAAGLAGFYRVEAAPTGTLEKALGSMRDARYTPLAAPAEPCRSDAETSNTTLGEIAFPDRRVTVWTCTLTKKGHAYFLAWAASSEMLDEQQPRLLHILRGSQLVSNNLCAANVINGGCTPSTSALVSAIVASARN